MATDSYFFDSYALIEIVLKNPNYLQYATKNVVTTKLNLFEVCFSLLRKSLQNEAKTFLDYCYDFTVDFDKELIQQAAQFRLQNMTKNLSMTDCIGYCLAQQFGIRFLTGDKEFKGIENVEFVK